jgi:DNA-binding transcriptional ArsR family regulator
VVITDPRAVRALAHKARVEALDELYAASGTRTATELAARCGLSPSAMSYHLRALEKYGLVERAASEGDARERRWRAAGDQLVVRPGGGSETGTTAYVDMQLNQFRQKLSDEINFRSKHRGEPKEGDLQDISFMNYGSLYLDAATEREFMERVQALAKEFEARADDANRSSEDGRRVHYLLSAIPDRSHRP